MHRVRLLHQLEILFLQFPVRARSFRSPAIRDAACARSVRPLRGQKVQEAQRALGRPPPRRLAIMRRYDSKHFACGRKKRRRLACPRFGPQHYRPRPAAPEDGIGRDVSYNHAALAPQSHSAGGYALQIVFEEIDEILIEAVLSEMRSRRAWGSTKLHIAEIG